MLSSLKTPFFKILNVFILLNVINIIIINIIIVLRFFITPPKVCFICVVISRSRLGGEIL